MTKSLYLLALATALATHALATAQASTGTKVTEARQNPAVPDPQPSPVSAGAPSGNAGSTVNSTGRNAEESVAVESPDTAANSELQTLIQNAMSKQPALAGSSVNVTVSPEGIELNGNVSSSRGRLTAARLAHSYAGSKKIINHIVVTERGGGAPPQ